MYYCIIVILLYDNMKRNVFCLLYLLCLTFCSCTSDECVDMSNELFTPKASTENSSSNILYTDSIEPITGKRDSLKRSPITRSSYEDIREIREEVSQLNEIPIYLQVQGNSNSRQFLNVRGKGKELTVENFKPGSINQQFYIKVLPPSTGIMYLIYSKKTNTPIRLGAYKSRPDEKVLYASRDADGSFFGGSWDFKRGEYSENSFVIENQDFPQRGNSGYWLDIYYSVITVDGAKISFSKYNNSPKQEFAIIPVEEFRIDKIEFDLDASPVLTQVSETKTQEYTNDTPINQTYSFTMTKSFKKTSSFTKKTTFQVNVSTDFKVKVPFLADSKISTSVTSGREFTYGKSEEYTTTFNYSYPVIVPAYSKVKFSLIVSEFNMDVEYIATCTGLTSGKKIKIRGRWTGKDLEHSNAVLNTVYLNEPGVEQTQVITHEMLENNGTITVK